MLNESKYHISSEEMLSEQKEIEAAKADPAQFEVLYNRYYEPILQFVYKRVEGKDAAFDITSQVFLNAMLKLAQFKFMGTPFSSWLYRIALNEINMLYRKDKIQRSIKVEEHELKSVIQEINPDDDIDAQYSRVTEILADFEEEDVQLIELRFFEKRAFKEIGDIMNMTENNAKVKLYRLLDKLKSQLTLNKKQHNAIAMKNQKIKIETGSEKLTKEEISTNKDFSKVYKTYTTTKTNTVKTPKKFGGMTTMVVVTTTVVVTTIGAWKYWSYHKTADQPKVSMASKSSSSSNSNTRTATTSANSSSAKAVVKHPYINPPLKGVNVPYKTYSVNATKGGTLTFNNSKVVIPAAAFRDASGKDITGKVDIKYREFRNAADFFASGIPMTYDSAGKQYTFESAGMMDIRGYQNGKEVFIKTGKDVQVSMITTERKISYNIYELDTVNQKWNYISKSKSVPIPVAAAKADTSKLAAIVAPERKEAQQIQSTIASIKQDEAKLEKAKPMEPKKATTGKNTFNIDADPTDYPELSVYKNLIWEPDAADKNYKPSYATITWDDASLKRSADGNTYNFTVKKGQEEHSFIVHPVFEGKDYDVAKKEYDKKYEEYQTAFDKRKAEEKKQQEAYEAMLAKIKQQQEEAAKRMVTENLTYAASSYFTIHNFGIINSDSPQSMPRGAELAAAYTDNNNDDLNQNDFYMIEKGRNTLYIHHPGHNCKFNPKKENFAWIVTPDNMLAIYTVDDFAKIGATRGDFTFRLKVLEKKIGSMDELKEAFKPYVGDLDQQWGGRSATL